MFLKYFFFKVGTNVATLTEKKQDEKILMLRYTTT